MLNKDEVKFGPLPKDFLVMAVWGVLLLAGGLIQQYGKLDLDGILVMWAVVTLLGAAGQALAYVNGLTPNNLAWAGTIIAAWAFTLLALKANIQDSNLYEDMPAVWFVLLGIGFIFTAQQVGKIFYILATVYLLTGIILEIGLRFMQNEFLASNAPLIMAFVGGGSLIVASIVAYVLRTRQATNKSMAESTPLVS